MKKLIAGFLVLGVAACGTAFSGDTPCRTSSQYEPDFEELVATPRGAYQQFRALMLEQIDRVEDGSRARGLDQRLAHMRDGLLELGPEPDSLEVVGSTATVGDRERLHFTLSEVEGGGWAVTESSQALDASACE